MESFSLYILHIFTSSQEVRALDQFKTFFGPPCIPSHTHIVTLSFSYSLSKTRFSTALYNLKGIALLKGQRHHSVILYLKVCFKQRNDSF